MTRTKDISGSQYNNITAISFIHKDKHNNHIWECKCFCGVIFAVQKQKLTSLTVKSCGCLENHKTHNMSFTSTYKSWQAMIYRCTNIKSDKYYRYGGRGITVCARWINSFENFYVDMGDRPEGKTLDRVNVDGNYEPSNCKWSTPKEQANNRRSSK